MVLLPLAAACTLGGDGGREPPRPVERVDLERYLGRWYEIARYPNRFQEGCVATTAAYSARDDGRIGVRNECRTGGANSMRRSIDGVAWSTEPGGAKLKVQFFWPFRGDYWILELDPDYRWAVVGHPTRRYLWILSRTPTLDEATYAELLRRIEAQGYDPDRLEQTPQSLGEPQ